LNQEDAINNDYLIDVMSTWTLLNVFGESLQLDSFTLDDCLDALRYQEVDYPCELISEMHCALLKALISPAGDTTVYLPQPLQPQVDPITPEEEDSDIMDTTPFFPPEYSALLNLRAQASKPGSQSWTDWRNKIYNRDFNSGGWQFIVLGILDELGNSPHLTAQVVEIMSYLIPRSEKLSRKTVKESYLRMDSALKVRTLHLLSQLVCQTPSVRDHIEECMTSMTELRKDKVDAQRERKVRIEELSTLEAELQPFTPPEEPNGMQEESDSASIDETKRSVKASLKRKREEQEERLATITRTKQYNKRLKLVDSKRAEITACEDKIAQYDVELREKDCQRLRLLGKDRFYNRYWYLEGNGLVTGEEGRAEAGYASARLWVQGPSFDDAAYFLGGVGLNEQQMSDDEMLRDRIQARKEREEGQTILCNEHEWGYYDEAEGVEGLIAWLNPKGIREAKLRTALLARKDSMYEAMEARKKVPMNLGLADDST
jgi:Williams-Beuren syndrome DDT (WSD), D-TOX E motif/DDT domain